MLNRKVRVFVDKGHTVGVDNGASGGGMTEAKINSNVADMLAVMLVEAGFEVLVSKPRLKEKLSLTERISMAVKFKADISISIHHNAGGGLGCEILAEFNDVDSLLLASLINKHFSKLTVSRGVKTKISSNGKSNYFAMLNIRHCVNVITEFAFLDNPFDVKKVDSLAEQKLEAKAIKDAVVEFRGSM